MKLVLFIVGLMAILPCNAQKLNETIRSGNDFYKAQQFDEALKKYSEAQAAAPPNETVLFNLASTRYRTGRHDEAIKDFNELVKTSADNELRSKSFYNQGAILSRQKKLEESIEAYKGALRLNPNDNEARENLQKALLELKKKQPPKPKEDKQKKQQQKQKQQQQPKMNKKEAEQRLKLLEQKEKEVQQRLQKEKSKTGGSQTKDW